MDVTAESSHCFKRIKYAYLLYLLCIQAAASDRVLWQNPSESKSIISGFLPKQETLLYFESQLQHY